MALMDYQSFPRVLGLFVRGSGRGRAGRGGRDSSRLWSGCGRAHGGYLPTRGSVDLSRRESVQSIVQIRRTRTVSECNRPQHTPVNPSNVNPPNHLRRKVLLPTLCTRRLVFKKFYERLIRKPLERHVVIVIIDDFDEALLLEMVVFDSRLSASGVDARLGACLVIVVVEGSFLG